MDNLLSFDIELYNDIPQGTIVTEFSEIIPSVAAICSTENDVTYFYDDPYMTKETAKQLVKTMLDYVNKKFILLTWNGLSFDFPLLATYSGMIEECATIALNSIDMMFTVVCMKGYPLGLNKVLLGTKVGSKKHEVLLNSGETINNMSGKIAPEMWRNKEFSAVREYLKDDVVQPLKLAEFINTNKSIRWESNSGRINVIPFSLMTVRECVKLSVPDTNWISNLKPRIDYYSWIPENLLKDIK